MQRTGAGNVAGAGSGTGYIFAIFVQYACNIFATFLQHLCNMFATCLQHLCSIFATFLQRYVAGGAAGTGSGALQRLGALQERCRGRIRSVAASGSVAGALQGQDQVSGARFETLSRYQDRSRGRICDVARVCYRGACLRHLCNIFATVLQHSCNSFAAF